MEGIGKVIYADTINNAWYQGLNMIWNYGSVITDERRNQIRELLNLMVVIKNPYVDNIPKETSLSKSFLEEYSEQLITGENSQNFEYTYGQRLRNWNNQVDQIAYAIEALKRNKTTRRATTTTWLPTADTMTDEVPCMIVNDFKLRDGNIYMTTLFRSHDFAGAYPANLYGLSKLLEYIAEEVGVLAGEITTISVSAHICGYDWNRIENINKEEKWLKNL